ncbi:reverse transcriptase-like protein [Halalkalicoccus sp. NIPERK01]|uniref:reverse transcriptase-like protein n=1 Tax=Halalkalicoccus sp. NIPERK01 TaxID=3053469 RepID=UPI00256F48A0|nr:reverse transcriptase-like protein [Halalkalicoccus sp. NIPERK01]MDL5361502.1 reverse transcriptase-like protein [Halalkalicoccus sp. NIPERK01]
MAAYGRRSLRDRFDSAPTPHVAHPPRTHHRDFYVATDGSYHLHDHRAGMGVVIETRDGERVARFALPTTATDNNVAEYQALHFGLDVLAARAPRTARVGVLTDHDSLATNVNATALATRDGWHPGEIRIPPAGQNHWRGIRARIAGFAELRAAVIDGADNPAHPLANSPEEYAHVNREPDRCLRPETPPVRSGPGVPPPSRADRHAGD